jgi:NAD+ synthase (glutamine-hydrolysing)
MPIDASVASTVAQINETPVKGQAADFHLALTPFMTENIQARDRSSRLLAGIAAAFGAVFTCNANKSELTIGYSTLYGDMAGFFAVTADLWKYQVYELARYLNEAVYKKEVIPRASLDLVPSAELSFKQNVDQGLGDPLVYPYHDHLFKAFLEDAARPAPADILAWYLDGSLEEKIGCEKGLVKKIFKNSAEFMADLEKWWSLYTGFGVAKRLQGPPLLALSPRAYGFDYPEAQNGVYYTQEYLRLKKLAQNGAGV